MTPDEQVIDMIKSRRKLESSLRQDAIELAEFTREVSALTDRLRKAVEQRDTLRAKIREARGKNADE